MIRIQLYIVLLATGFNIHTGAQETPCYIRPRGTDYRGLLNVTETGKQCMPWASSNPHSHRFTYVKGQFCRNPDNEPRTWCYTTDPEVRYEFCNVTACETTNSTCYENSRERPYSGTINITVTGYPCQRWDSQSPNRHTFTDVSEENYCRTPDGAVVPWCYSTNPTKRWEECQIVPCEKSATVYGCYEGWEDYGGNCYKIEKNMSTWKEADSACKKMDSELTSILTGEEQQFILGIMSADLCFNTRKLSDCKKWADQGDCVKNPLFMIQYCRQSCDHEVFCNTDCAMDAHENSAQCGRWQTSGECARNPLWMLSHCAYSCQVCSNVLSAKFWIGAEYRKLALNNTSSDVPFSKTFSKMSTGNVSKPTSADCLGINIKDGLWEWSTCNTALPGYVCKRPKTYFTGKPRKSCQLELHGMCYTIHSKKKSFEEAQAACKEPDIGGTLATITDAEQKNQISSRLKSDVQYYWILDGTDCKAIQKPRSAFGKNYISSRNCTEKHGFICSRVLPLSSLIQLRTPQNLRATTAPTISSTSDLSSNKTSDNSCGEGWIIYGKKCFKKLFHPWSWTTGRSHCFTIFADLASIHSKDENTFIVKTFPVNNFLWIGLRGSGSSWTDGSSVNFTSLSMTPTSNTTGCVAVSGDGTWTQRPCTKWYPVLCMRRIKESCGNVPAVDNAVVDNGTDTVGSIRTYSCNVGTTAGSGSRVIRCQSNFTWTVPMFKCYRNCYIKGQPYFGGYNITESGKPCQRWDARAPNKHGYKSWPNAIDNYCRMYEHSEPWCYTISKDSRWENCNVPLCPTNTDKITAAARLQGTPTGQGIQQQRRSVPSAIIFLIVGMVITLVCLTFLVIAVIILWRRKTVGRKYSDGIKFENAMYVRHTDETSSQQESSGSCKYVSD